MIIKLFSGCYALHGELREGQPAERAGVQPLQGRAGPESAERERTHRPAEEGGGRDAGGAAEGESDHLRDQRDPRVVRGSEGLVVFVDSFSCIQETTFVTQTTEKSDTISHLRQS